VQLAANTLETESDRNTTSTHDDQNDALELVRDQFTHQIREPTYIHLLPLTISVKKQFGVLGVVRDYFRSDVEKRPEECRPPADFTGPRVFLGARNVNYKIFSWLGIRHMYINIYENASQYALIECSPCVHNNLALSGAWIKEKHWDTRGVQWELVPHRLSQEPTLHEYEALIAGLRYWTRVYHSAGIPYRPKRGPNSNSFIDWLLRQCGLDISSFLPDLTYWGAGYWHCHPDTYQLLPIDTGLAEDHLS
jgi:hypothetical protein